MTTKKQSLRPADLFERSVYLDIETSWAGAVTIIGLYRPGLGTRQMIAPELSRDALLEAIDGAERVLTYNGSRFDLPVLHKQLGVDLASRLKHDDLMLHCWRHKLKGGLKKVELRLGIHRETEGVDGIAAMRLWEAHKKGDSEALEVLLKYNAEDVENLEPLERKLIELDRLHPEALKARPRAARGGLRRRAYSRRSDGR